MAFFSSLFLRLKTIGLRKGVKTVQAVAIRVSLSIEWKPIHLR